ncbi:MAG: FAD-dependent oxidoreductase [Thermodesulfobacteriota bacterium]|nr:FAD-dependent oxidoreductase [Thermodesulfobacteriota bacterium]
MKKHDAVIIGGSIGGMVSAITCRRHYPEKSILLIRKEEHALVPCGIPYIFGTVGSVDKNFLSEAVYEKNRVEVMIDEVTGIDPGAKCLSTAKGEEMVYDKLVIATGSIPIVPPIPGVDKKNVFAGKKDVFHLREFLDRLKVTSDLVIVGGGFIGVEFADECKKSRAINVKLVEMLPHCLMLAYDEDLCIMAENLLQERGIDILTSQKVEMLLGNDNVDGVKLTSGEKLRADAVFLGIGVTPDTILAEKAGLEIGPTKSIQVNRYMQTSDENIFACGDCTEKVSFFDGKPSNLKLGAPASMEARIVGANLFEIQRANRGVIGVFSTALGPICFAVAGLTERAAKEKGYNIVIGEAEAINRHPGGMPEAEKMKVKLVFERDTGIILGGQISGAKSGGELINTVSSCIYNGMTAEDMAIFQMGTQPALTASPILYQLVNAAEEAIINL